MRPLLLGSVVALMAAAACNDNIAPVAGSGRIQLALSTRATPPAAPGALRGAGFMGPDTIAGSTDTLVIDSAQVVLRKVELKGISAAPCDTLSDDHDDCEEFEAGPILVPLPIGDTALPVFNVSVPAGTYDRVEFQIHAPKGSADAAFLAANPVFDGVSIRVTGTFNGTPFTFTTDLTAEQELSLVPPLVVSDSGSAALTIRTDIRTWFLDGAAVVDPATALKGGPNENLVKDNIRSSFRGFHDRDHDGLDDDGEDGHDGGDH